MRPLANLLSLNWVYSLAHWCSAQWKGGGKAKPKVAHLGEESNIYYNEKVGLGRGAVECVGRVALLRRHVVWGPAA